MLKLWSKVHCIHKKGKVGRMGSLMFIFPPTSSESSVTSHWIKSIRSNIFTRDWWGEGWSLYYSQAMMTRYLGLDNLRHSKKICFSKFHKDQDWAEQMSWGDSCLVRSCFPSMAQFWPHDPTHLPWACLFIDSHEELHLHMLGLSFSLNLYNQYQINEYWMLISYKINHSVFPFHNGYKQKGKKTSSWFLDGIQKFEGEKISEIGCFFIVQICHVVHNTQIANCKN